MRNFLKTFALGAVLLGSIPAGAASLSYVTGPQPAADLQSIINTLIRNINTTIGTSGSGTPSSAIYIPTVASAVNLLSITPGATGNPVLLSVGGDASDANRGIILSGKGTGAAHLGGTTIANSSIRVPTVASAVNQVQLSGAITTAEPIITPGGSSADSAIGIVIAGKSTGSACLGGSTCANASLSAPTTTSAVNQVVATGQATGTAPTLQAGGSSADTNVNLSMLGRGTGIAVLGLTTTTSGTTTSTASTQRATISVTGLTTAAGAESAAMTVTDTKVSSTSQIVCQVNGYVGTGKPIIYNPVPGTGSFTFTVLNVATSGSLNATVPVACLTFG